MQADSKTVRVRIAPSPTGDPHIGTAYIALFNYIFAKKHGGQFLVRIEDTDQNRYRADSESMILDALKWVGLPWDEGPDVGGPCAPYRQSERTQLYVDAVNTLVESGHAYRCFCTPQRLEELRKSQLAQKLPPGYDRLCRDLPAADVARKRAEGLTCTIRLKMPLSGKTVFKDGLRGQVEFDNDGVDDQVLLKSDGFPTYHLANVVDDHHMNISHVIRGEEWISSTPKHVQLYDAFGWRKPEFIHLPLLRNSDKSKISKRKNPTSINYYRRKGILPEALRNFLALMGWNFGDNREIFSTAEMVAGFTWERMTLGGPVFDLQKLAWLNGQYLKTLPDEDYAALLRRELFSVEALKALIPLVRERVEKLEDFIPSTDFFFAGDLDYKLSKDKEALVPAGRDAEWMATVFGEILDAVESADGFSHKQLHDLVDAYVKSKGYKAKEVFMPLRIALTGRKESPPLFETIEALGKEMFRRRLRMAQDYLRALPLPAANAPAPKPHA